LRLVDRSRRQGALSRALRTAVSLPRLERDQDSIGEPRDLLSSAYSRFAEGFGSTDLQLDELA
jgi:predicted ATPase